MSDSGPQPRRGRRHNRSLQISAVATTRKPLTGVGRYADRYYDPITGRRKGAGMSQQLDALAIANQVRVAGSQLKREVTAGLPLDVALTDPRALSLRIDSVLRSVPMYGKAKVARLLRDVRVLPSCRVRDLTVRQRTELVARVDARLGLRARELSRRQIRNNGGPTSRPPRRSERPGGMAREAVPPMQHAAYPGATAEGETA